MPNSEEKIFKTRIAVMQREKPHRLRLKKCIDSKEKWFSEQA
jgi:hypothetical protein